MVREASGLVQSNPSVKGEYGIARDGERGKGQSEQWTGTHQPSMKKWGRMDGYKWSGNSFLLGPSSLANHAGFLNRFLTTYLLTNNPHRWGLFWLLPAN